MSDRGAVVSIDESLDEQPGVFRVLDPVEKEERMLPDERCHVILEERRGPARLPGRGLLAVE